MNSGFTVFQYWLMIVSASSLFVSFIALIISWVNARRTNASVLRIVDARGHSTWHGDSDKTSHRFAVWVRNLGLPLQDASLWLRFVAKDGSGTTRIQMPRYSMENEQAIRGSAELGKGMVGLFEVRSEDPWALPITVWAPVKKDRYLDVYSSGYKVQSCRIGGWRDRLAKRWNRLAWKINPRFDKTVTTHEGESRFKPGAVLPLVRNLEWHLDYFLRATRPNKKPDGLGTAQETAGGEDADEEDRDPAPD